MEHQKRLRCKSTFFGKVHQIQARSNCSEKRREHVHNFAPKPDVDFWGLRSAPCHEIEEGVKHKDKSKNKIEPVGHESGETIGKKIPHRADPVPQPAGIEKIRLVHHTKQKRRKNNKKQNKNWRRSGLGDEVFPSCRTNKKKPLKTSKFRLMRGLPFISSTWPDPNSPILSKIDFGVPLPELLKWLDVRDTLLGQNKKKQDITAALALALDCKHPDAVWLTSIFEGKNVSTKEDARKVFLSSQNDARGLCFAWWMTDDRGHDLSLLHRASEMGNAFAHSTLCLFLEDQNGERAFRLAQKAAIQHEIDGFYWLGCYYRDGVGCERDLRLANENFLITAEVGDIGGALNVGDLAEFDATRWLWWSRAACRGLRASFLVYFSEQVEKFFSGSRKGNASVVFLIGRALKGNIDVEKKRIFGESYGFDSLIEPAKQAVSFYDMQIKSVRLAVDTWTLLSTRFYLIKDMRLAIGKMIWDARFEANYKI